MNAPAGSPVLTPSETDLPETDLPGSGLGAPPIDLIDDAEFDALDAEDVAAPHDPHAAGPKMGSELGSEDAARGDVSSEALQTLILKKLDDDQAEDVLVIDLAGKSPLADAVVIASGRSQRHVSAIADHLQRALKTAGLGRVPVEGLPHADWVLIDAGDVVVHLFRPEVRAFYQIEKIWSVDSPHRTPAAVG